MSRQSILLTPGPVPMHPKVREILALPAEHHRTPAFTQVFTETIKKLPQIFQSQQRAFVLPSTGSGAMEALITNSFSSGDEVICVVAGKFGERFVKIAQTYGLRSHSIDVPWGEAVTLEQIKKCLHEHPQSKALLIQACETSTATAHPIQEIGELLHNEAPELLFYVDGITALGAYPLKMDEWHIDGLIGGSQKAFMLPVGLSFLCLSKKAWQSIEKSQLPRFYFDLKLEAKANDKGQSFFSTPVHMFKALSYVLDLMIDDGLQNFYAEIQKRADFTKALCQYLQLNLFSQSPSPSVTAICVPKGMDGKAWRSRLEKDFGLVLMGGQDQLEGKILRVGHMGFIENQDLIDFAERLSESLENIHSNIKSTDAKAFAAQWLKEHQ